MAWWVMQRSHLPIMAVKLFFACHRGDASRVKHLLEITVKQQPFNLPAIAADSSDPEAQAALLMLDQVLYSGNKISWRGEDAALPLLHFLFRYTKRTRSSGRTALPPFWRSSDGD